MIYVGIDPGLKGGIALIMGGANIAAFPMPTIQAGKKTVMDLSNIKTILTGLAGQEPVFVTVEKVIPFGGKPERVMVLSTRKVLTAMIGQSVSATAYFQQQYGELIGLLTGMEIPFMSVAPVTWKRAVLKDMSWQGAGKSPAILYVQRRFPGLSLLPTPRHRVPHDGMAEAACIAEYGKMEKEF